MYNEQATIERKVFQDFQDTPQYFQVTTYTQVKDSNKESSHNEFRRIQGFTFISNITLELMKTKWYPAIDKGPQVTNVTILASNLQK